MAPETITQERIYHAIKGEMLSGRWRPGARIDLQAIADRHRASTTPVREAVHRLIGERLFEPHPDSGFQIAVLEAPHLAHLYAWFGHEVLSALHNLKDATLARVWQRFRDGSVPNDPLLRAEWTDQIFETAARATDNYELIVQITAANERLRYARLAEMAVFSNYGRELENLTRNGNLSGISNVRRRVSAYHERRILHAENISDAVRAAG